jgi:hypothetical protein
MRGSNAHATYTEEKWSYVSRSIIDLHNVGIVIARTNTIALTQWTWAGKDSHLFYTICCRNRRFVCYSFTHSFIHLLHVDKDTGPRIKSCFVHSQFSRFCLYFSVTNRYPVIV